MEEQGSVEGGAADITRVVKKQSAFYLLYFLLFL